MGPATQQASQPSSAFKTDGSRPGRKTSKVIDLGYGFQWFWGCIRRNIFQPSSHPASKPASQPVGQPVSQPASHTTNQSARPAASQQVCHPARLPAIQPASKPTNQFEKTRQIMCEAVVPLWFWSKSNKNNMFFFLQNVKLVVKNNVNTLIFICF